MRVTLPAARRILLFLLGGILIFSVGFALGQRTRVTFNGTPDIKISRELPPDKQSLNFSLFWETWDRLHRDYFSKEKLDPTELIYGAIRGMVTSVGDPYTEFLPPQKQKILKEDLQGSFEGIGINIGFKGTQLAVIAPVQGTPAEVAGIRAGDFIIGIKDERRKIDRSTVGITLQEAVESIRGPAGSEVTLFITREGVEAPFDVKIVRAKINVPSVELKFVVSPKNNEKQVAHLKLLSFGEETSSEWTRAVGDIAAKCQMPLIGGKCSGVILDLRNNHGGFLNGSVFIASEFLRSGAVVIQENSSGQKTTMSVDRQGKLTNVPLVVLVNKGSASAAEIVAGAIKNHKRAKLVGEATFGKGTIQESRELTGGAGLKITTARWLVPDGTWVNEKGLAPDVEIKDNPDTKEDEQLDLAIQELLK